MIDNEEKLRKKIFKEELIKLTNSHYLSEKAYFNLVGIHEKYYEIKNNQDIKVVQTEKSTEVKKTVYVKKDVNIKDWYHTLILVFGVILVLISGVIFATTTWDLFKNNVLKVAYLSLGSILFFSASLLAEKKLKIEKTGFAFWILGSLYIPILILSIGFFKLLGEYLSLFGEGKYLLGCIGSLICFPIYLISSKKYNNRIFSYITFGFTTLITSFLTLHIHESVFLLLLVNSLYTLILIFVNEHILEKINSYKFMKPDLKYYSISISLILTFLMIFIFPYKHLVLNDLDRNVRIIFYGTLLVVNTVLAYKHQNKLFGYLVLPISLYIVNEFHWFNLDASLFIVMRYLIVVVIFTTIYFLHHKFLFYIKQGTLHTSFFVFSYLFIQNIIYYWTINAILMIFTSLIAYFVYKKETKENIRGIPIYVMYFYLFLGVLQLYDLIYKHYGQTNVIHFFNYLTFTVFIMFVINLLLNKYDSFIGKKFYYLTNLTLFKVFITVMIANLVIDRSFIFSYIITIILCISNFFFTEQIEHQKHKFVEFDVTQEKKISIYGTLISISALVVQIFNQYNIGDISIGLLVNSFITLLIWIMFNVKWKKVVFNYLVLIIIFNLLITFLNIQILYIHLNENSYLDLVQGYLITLISTVMLLILLYKEKKQSLIPIGLFFYTVSSIYVFTYMFNLKSFFYMDINFKYYFISYVFILQSIIYFIIGTVIYKKVYRDNKDNKMNTAFDYYLIVAFINLITAYAYGDEFSTYILIDLITVLMVLFQYKRVDSKTTQKLFISASLYIVLLPYYRTINYITVDSSYYNEVVLIPLIVITSIVTQWIFKGVYKKIQILEWLILKVSMLILFIDVINGDLSDGILFGVITILMIIYGYIKKVNSYIITGSIYLTLFVFYESRYFWIEVVPWWAYLLTAGLVLIGVASLGEIRRKNNKSFKLVEYLKKQLKK